MILDQLHVIIDYSHSGLFRLKDSTLAALALRGPQPLEQALPIQINLQNPQALTMLFNKRWPTRIADVQGSEPPARFLRSLLGDRACILLEGIQSWMWVPLDGKGCACGPDCKCEHCKTGKGECTCKAGKDCKCGKGCKCDHCSGKGGKCGCHAGKDSAASDTSTTQTSTNKLFKASYTTDPASFPVNKIHSWTLKVETADGKPVTDAEIAIAGDMPDHGHGLPTQPKMSENLGNGSYLIEGVKFSMPGFWVMTFTVKAGGTEDKVNFNLNLK